MAEIKVNLEAIKNLNEVARVKNEERLRLKGAVDEAKKSYDNAVAAYATKYGVQLDSSNIQAEFDKVSTELSTAYAKLQSDIEYIESGKYKEKAVEETVVEPAVEAPVKRTRTKKAETVVTETVEKVPEVVTPEVKTSDVVTPTPTVNASAPKVAIPVMEAPVVNSTPVTNIPLDALDMASKQVVPKAPVDDVDDVDDAVVESTPAVTPNTAVFGTPAVPTVEEEPVEEKPFTPDGWGGNKPDLDASFGSILGNAGTIKFGE